MIICSFAPFGLAHGPNTCQIWCQWGPDYVACIYLDLLDRFSLAFEVPWKCLDLQLWSICPFDTYGIAHGPEHISLKLLDGFSRSSVELSWLVFVQNHVIYPFSTYGLAHCCPFDPYGLAHWSECQYLKLLERFSPFKVLWNCLNLQLCSILCIFPFDPYMGLPMGQISYLWNHWMVCSFSDLWAEGCWHHLNTLLEFDAIVEANL